MWTLILDWLGGALSSESGGLLGGLLGGLFGGNSSDTDSRVGWYVAGALGVLLVFIMFAVLLVGLTGRRR